MENKNITFSSLKAQCNSLYKSINNSDDISQNSKINLLNEVLKLKRIFHDLVENYKQKEKHDSRLILLLKILLLISLLMASISLLRGNVYLLLVGLIIGGNLYNDYKLVKKYNIIGTYDNDIVNINMILENCEKAINKKGENYGVQKIVEDEHLKQAQMLLDNYLATGNMIEVIENISDISTLTEITAMLQAMLQTNESNLFKLLFMIKWENDLKNINTNEKSLYLVK